MTYDLSPAGVAAALADLDKGGSEDVAIRLQELGIRGDKDNDCDCPVARYLIAVVPGIESATVGAETAFVTGIVSRVIEGHVESDSLRYVAHLPESVSAFVEDFDAGCYPELIEENQSA